MSIKRGTKLVDCALANLEDIDESSVPARMEDVLTTVTTILGATLAIKLM